MKVLIVEDDAEIRRYIRMILQTIDASVEEAADGVKALRILDRDPGFDLVITDIIMPEKEGLETIREIKQAFPLLKIICISGGGKIGAGTYLELAKRMGVDRTLQKPFMKNELLGIIRGLT